MVADALPFSPIADHRAHARLSSHVGTATFRLDDVPFEGIGEFLLPADGQSIIAFHTTTKISCQDFGTHLVVEGICESGPFRVESPYCFVRHEMGGVRDSGGWHLISPVNGPVRAQYGSPRQVRRATALLNNFDYRLGDTVTDEMGFNRIGTPLVINLGDRRITFHHHAQRERLLPLVQAGVLHSASLTEVSFDVAPDESDDLLLELGADIAAICTFASGPSVSVAMLELFDNDDALVRRLIPQPVLSRYRTGNVLHDIHLTGFFGVAFGEYVRMKQNHKPWRKLASHCGSLEDSPFLEQKFASLIMAIEFFARNCLIEQGHDQKWVASLDFLALIGASRKHLGWDIPKHYVARQAIRVLRNAVMHGGELPTKDSSELRWLFDKWRLFLFRRVLIRLGYVGQIVSPHRGWTSMSDVADFREEHNSFTPTNQNAHPWMQLVTALRSRETDHRE